MAGDWIKMRGNLWDDPRVAAIVDATDASEAAVIGGLYWLWAAADQHTENGFMPGLSLRQIDRKTGVSGLGAAMASVGWIAEEDGGIRIARFEEHNGESAKRRCMEAKRKAGARKVSASDADKVRTKSGHHAELEKEKEIDQKQDQKKKQPRVTAQPPPDDVDPQTWADWLALRRAKRAPVTETVIRDARREAGKAGLPLARFLEIWCARGSQGLQADWLKPHERPQSPRAGPDQPMGKQMQGIAALEELKNAARQRMATAGSGNGAPEALLSLAGSDARR